VAKTNLTLTIDEATLRRARIKAVQEGTSVNAVVREHLERYGGSPAEDEARRRFLELSRRSQAGSGPEGRTWTREELYDRQVLR
jgi:hypothetical protein